MSLLSRFIRGFAAIILAPMIWASVAHATVTLSASPNPCPIGTYQTVCTSIIGAVVTPNAPASIWVSLNGAAPQVLYSAFTGTTTWSINLPAGSTYTVTAYSQPFYSPPIMIGPRLASLVVTAYLPAPVILNPAPAAGLVGYPFGDPMEASNPGTWSATGLPPGLSIRATDGYISGIPTASGTFTATVQTTNASGTASATLTITIAPSAPPTANPQNVSTAFQTAVGITLTGSDPNNLSLTYVVISTPTHGSLSGTAPNLTYTPVSGFSGVDSFTFRVNNGFVNSPAAAISITVAPPAAPTAFSQSVATAFNTAIAAITLSGSDPNNLPLVYIVISSPTHGSLSGTAPNLTYTPANGFSGADNFTFRVNNGFVNSSTAAVSITVNPPTTAPTSNPQNVSTPFQTPVGITLTGSDPNNLPLAYIVISLPTHGVLSGTAPNLTYTSVSGFSGADSFTFKVNNGYVNSSTATVSITVNPPTAAPTAKSQSVATAFNTAIALTLSGSDPNNLPLLYIVISSSTHGTLSGTAPNLTYTPANEFSGADSFTFKVNNGYVNSSTATVSITVNPPTAAPTAKSQSVATAFNTAIALTLSGSDPNNLPLTYIVISSPTQGSLSGTAPNLTYTPVNGFSGADSFTFMVNNGFVTSSTATISITVNPPTTAPTANPQTVVIPFTTGNRISTITLTGSDPNNLPLTYTVTSSPAHGFLSGTAPNLMYAPVNGFAGSDSFTFKVNNGFVNSSTATVSITVTGPSAPMANAQSVTTSFNSAKAITLTGSDPNNLPLTYIVTALPGHGTLSGTAPNLTYTPVSGFTGSDSFSFETNNGFLNSSLGTVSITVTGPSAPTANAQSITTAFNTAIATITLSGSDPNNLPLTYVVVSTPTHGVLSGTAPNLTYTPINGFAGSDSFTFVANNGSATSSAATVSITVTPPSAPTANSQSVTTAFNTAISTITLSGSDPNNLPLTYIVISTPTHGVLSRTAPNLTYTPNNGFVGTDSFTFRVNNGFVNSSSATVSITVNPPTAAPTAKSQSVTTAFNTAIGITLSGSDPNNLPLAYLLVSTPTHGSLSGTAPNLTYTPVSGFSGADSFTFKVNNGYVTSSTATVSIAVAPPAAPTANPQTVVLPFTTGNPGAAITLTGSDPDNLPLAYVLVSSPTHGVLSGTAPNLTYRAIKGFAGSDSFTFLVNNGYMNSAPATVSITEALPAAPTANLQTVPILFNGDNPGTAITLTGSDPNNLPLTYVVTSSPTYGTLFGTAPNLIYQAGEGFNGLDSFTFEVNNGYEYSLPATISLGMISVYSPTANAQSVTTAFNTPIAITLTGANPPNLPPVRVYPLYFIVVSSPAFGTLSGTAPNLTYTPNNGFVGTDSLTFETYNTVAYSSPAVVSIAVSTPAAPSAAQLSIGTFSAAPGSVVQVPVQFTVGPTGISTLLFSLTLPAGISNATATAGFSATAAGKFVSGSLVGGTLSVSVMGFSNTMTIASGDVVDLTLTLAASASGALPLQLSNLYAIDSTGNIVPLTAINGSIIVPGAGAPIAGLTSGDGLLAAPALEITGPTPVNGNIPVLYSSPDPRTFNWGIVPESAGGSTASGNAVFNTSILPTPYSTTSASLQLAPLALSPGLYRISIQAVDSMGNRSVTSTADVMLVSASSSEAIRVFPNPWRADHPTSAITFDGLIPSSTVKIFTVSGRWVRTLSASGTSVEWDLKNDDGNMVASGLYIYLVTDSQGGKTHGKFAIIK